MENSPPANYDLQVTEDGSFTLYSHAFKEACHSYQGAQTETLTYYVKGCQILERVSFFTPLNILEIGFGTGLGYLLTMQELTEQAHHVEFISLEIDEDLVQWSNQKFFGNNLQKKETSFFSYYEFKNLKVILGDARSTLPLIPNIFSNFNPHAIYHDAFSPVVCPNLWSVEWFKQLKDISHPQCLFSTYSISSRVRKGLIEAGWILQEGQKFARKKGSTIAVLEGEHDSSILEHLVRSPVLPIKDQI